MEWKVTESEGRGGGASGRGGREFRALNNNLLRHNKEQIQIFAYYFAMFLFVGMYGLSAPSCSSTR